MKNHLFNNEMLQVLFNTQQWQIVSSLFTPQINNVRHLQYTRWRKKHNHGHQHREILIALEGFTHFGFKNQIYPCKPGSVFLLNHNELHDDCYPPFSPDISHLWIYLTKNGTLACILKIHQKKLINLTKPNIILSLSEPSRLLQKVWNELTDNKSLPENFMRIKLSGALHSVVAEIVQKGYDLTLPKKNKNIHDETIETVCHYIEETGGALIALDTLAGITGYNKFHLLRIFKKKCGRSIHEYINRIRIDRVKGLIEEGYTKKSISEMLGFSCPACC